MPRDDGPVPPAEAMTHALDIGAVARLLEVDPAAGLTDAEASRRFSDAGPNTIESASPESLGRMVVRALSEPFVVMLALAGVLAIVVGEARDGLLVLLGLLPIVGADVVTEYRGERALEALREASAPSARVRRNGTTQMIAGAALVPGDVVVLQAGDVVPADLRLTRAHRLLIDSSVLTGESVPTDAHVSPDANAESLAERRSMAYSGTSVVGGRGEGLVVATGSSTEVGRIAAGLATQERRRSPLQRELDRLVRILLVVAIALIAFTAGLGFLRGHALGQNVLAGISAAIAAIPEEPPVLLAVILGLGAYRLLKRRVLVRRLNAEETLGAVDLIITDKTGTLTRNRLVVSSVRTATDASPGHSQELSLLGEALRAEEDAWPQAGTAPGSFTRALRAAVEARGGDAHLQAEDLIEAHPIAPGIPITRTLSTHDGVVREHVLGAPEAILDLVGTELPAGEREAWEDRVDRATRDGERLVALARRGNDGPWEMRALIGFADPIRPEIRQAMRMAQSAGIQVVVVTGDHPYTAAAIAREAGLRADHIVTGPELASWDEERLGQELGRLHVVARSTPEQKLRLVRAARAQGRTVAVTGDGVNDAPALHSANVSAAMGSGTAVAREASDLVLGDDSFGTLMFGLLEGRRIVDNVQKGLVFIVSTHVAFLGFILLATIAISQGQVLIPLQILWMELFIDLSTSIAFEREAPEPDVMSRRPRRADRPLLTTPILGGIALAGGFTAMAALALMLVHEERDFAHAAWLAYTALVVGQCVRAYWNRALATPIHRLPPNGFLLAACLTALTIQAVIPAIPALATAFHATPLDSLDWLLVALVAFTPAVVAELVRSASGARRAWVA